MNTPVNFELAKMLIRKGIDHKNFYYWNMVNYSGEWKLDTRIWESCCDYYEAPTIADAVMWLYEKHGIWISVDCDCYGILWYANLSVASEKNWDNIDLRHEIISASKKFPNEHNSPTEAYEAAIDYTLNNLI